MIDYHSLVSLFSNKIRSFAGLALPLVFFIAWPISALRAFSFPEYTSSTSLVFFASTVETLEYKSTEYGIRTYIFTQ